MLNPPITATQTRSLFHLIFCTGLFAKTYTQTPWGIHTAALKLYKRGEKVRLLGVKFSHLVPMTLQMNLFDKEAERLQLFKAVDGIKAQFGMEAVKKASGLAHKQKKR